MLQGPPATLDFEMSTYLGIDLGTGGIRMLAVAADGQVLAAADQALSRVNTAFTDGHSEQDPGEWMEALDQSFARLFRELRNPIDAIAVTSTSGTVLPTDESGWPLAPAIMHNDVRAREEAAKLGMSPTFSLPKISWMQRHLTLPENARFLHATDFVNFYLGGPCPTDFTNAMKSGVDLDTLDWPPNLPARELLPAVVRPGTRIGQLLAAHVDRWGLPRAPLICAGATDSNAGFYASGASRLGDWSTTIGTTLAIKGICEDRIDDPEGRIYCHRHPDLAWLPGGACNAGGEILRKHFPDADFAELNRLAAEYGPSDHIVYPLARKGERLPIVNPEAEGFVEGDLDDRIGLYGGCLQGVAFTERWIYELLAELGADTSGCVATTGGGARSDYWLQLRADILQREVIVPAQPECAFGAAILAVAGHCDEPVADSASRMVRIAKRFSPRTEVDWDSRYRKFRALCATMLIVLCPLFGSERPNVVLIMVDDMGFSDIGCYGSEIDTPNINALAAGGVRFSHFYNSGRCCPTRATLMTGLHPHQVGIGHMTQPPNSDRGKGSPPAYQGYLNRDCATIGEALKGAGYARLMAGKWHLGYNAEDRWPLQRGFEKFYGCISGATRFFHPEAPRGMLSGNTRVTPESTTDEAFYTTDAFTDHAIRFLREEQAGQKRPAFLYLAYTAPHWPLQAFEDDIAKYRGRYKIGWDELRKKRLARQIELGLFSPGQALSPRTKGVPSWDSLDAKKQDEMELKMAVYAAMIDRVDQNIGKLVAYLKTAGLYENTLIMFLSDNGGCAEGGKLGRGNFYDIEARNRESSNSYGEAWANASNTPFRFYKHFTHEGGSATPFFLHWPARIAPQKEWFLEPAQLIDIMPTILDVAGGSYPSKLPRLDGVSLRPVFAGKTLARKQPIFVEHENNAFVRSGDWKLVGRGVSAPGGVQPDKWELYNLATDRIESKNLAQAHPERVAEFAKQWDEWAARAGVYPKPAKGKRKKK